MFTPNEYKTISDLLHMVLTNVVKNENDRLLAMTALDITLLGLYNLVDSGSPEPEPQFYVVGGHKDLEGGISQVA